MDKSQGVIRNPGYTIYRGDGQGRDSYILVGNGGLIKPEGYCNTPPRTGF